MTLAMEEGSHVLEAIEQSGFLLSFPEINLANNGVGIFSKPVRLQSLLRNGDRVEIYRALLLDPKEARRVRARGKSMQTPSLA